MSEQNIDSADRQTLEAMANDLGVQFKANIGDDSLRARIKQQLGQPADNEGGAAAGSAGPTPDNAASTDQAAPGESKRTKRFKIIVATHDQDKQPVQVGVNGRNYVIERGKEVAVPESVVEVLRNAVQAQYDPKTMEETKVMAYPFQVLGEA
ncbi:hypothetical protein [Bisbaumannia pacifica]|uniref:Uncharacterized protein n=1 Tax=Bisbaumannia pacifica TaxID=77098 RepID=A0ABD4KYG6_9GAMM|nr:hypothetical protein [Halomonas pacifica]MBH8578791.1 hypothetical protein [Halomonas pacifica]